MFTDVLFDTFRIVVGLFVLYIGMRLIAIAWYKTKKDFTLTNRDLDDQRGPNDNNEEE